MPTYEPISNAHIEAKKSASDGNTLTSGRAPVVDLTNSMILWTPSTKGWADKPNSGKMILVAWPPVARTDHNFRLSWGACNTEVREADFRARVQMLAQFMHDIEVRDRLTADEVNAACSVLDEYSA